VIAVLGATGRIGRHVVEALADQPVEAIALVRQPEGGELPIPARRGDFCDPASIRAALDGVTRLFLLSPRGPDQDLFEQATIRAAVAVGVERIVKISGSAASLGPSGTTSTGTAHWRSEQRIEQAGIGFSFLRPSYFQQNLLATVATTVARTGVLLSPFSHAPIAMIDVRDIAACAVAELINPRPIDQAWQLTGPRGVTFDELATRLGVRYLAIPPRAAAIALANQGYSASEVEHALRMAAYFAAGVDGAATDHVQRLTGRPPRAVDALLGEHRDLFAPSTVLAPLLSRTTTTPKD
jgi:NAD(P)H dehydrogenase (quinone)